MFDILPTSSSSKTIYFSSETQEATKKPGRYSVDCSKASTGLFLGIVVLTITIISLIVFFVFISHEDAQLRLLAVQVAAFSELTMYSLTSLAVMMAMCQIRKLDYDQHHPMELDNLLLVIAQTGVFIYAAFSIIGTFFQVLYLLWYDQSNTLSTWHQSCCFSHVSQFTNLFVYSYQKCYTPILNAALSFHLGV